MADLLLFVVLHLLLHDILCCEAEDISVAAVLTLPYQRLQVQRHRLLLALLSNMSTLFVMFADT